MEKLQKITSYLDSFLDIDAVTDTCWNGLQFEGKQHVEKVVLAVDAAYETFRKSLSLKADMIVVHHGHFWKSQNPSITGWSRKRLNILIKQNISLYACHLPLDRHRVVGNNAQILRLLGARIVGEFIHYKGKNIGWIGEFKSPRKIGSISSVLTKKLGAKCTTLPFGNENIKSVAVCSGGGGYEGFYESLSSGVDLYITGDSVEIYYSARDAGINVIFAGHHCTETIGLQALGAKLQSKFKLETLFLDMPTGL